MRRIILLITAALMAATMTVLSAPAFAAPLGVSTDHVDYVADISIQLGQEGDQVWGYFSLSDGCVDFFGAIDVPAHSSDTSNEFQGPACLF
jgi:hypothetical protein